MSAGAIRAALVALVASVADIGVVHDRERWIKTAEGLRALYLSPGAEPRTLRGWHIGRTGGERLAGRMGRGRTLIDRWRIVGYLGFDDAGASEHAASALADAVASKVDADLTLGGTVHDCNGDGDRVGVQVDSIRPVMFCGVLAHEVRLSLTTRSFAS